jgi:hypothetical protein
MALTEIGSKQLIKGSKTKTSTASTSEYIFTGLIDIDRNGIDYDGVTLTQVTLTDLDNIYDEWRSEAASTPKYYLFENGKVTLIPTPDTTGDSIIARGAYFADLLVVGGDYPFYLDAVKQEGLDDLEPLLLEYAIGMMKYSLGFYNNTQTALANFFGLLERKVAEKKPKKDMHRQAITKDPFLMRMRASRINENS